MKENTCSWRETQVFIQPVLLMFFYFVNLLQNADEYLELQLATQKVHDRTLVGVQGEKSLKKFDLFTSGWQLNSLN